MSPGPSTALVATITATLLLDMLVYGLVVPFLPEVAAHHGSSQAGTGVLFGAYALGLFFCALPMARLVPRIGPRAAIAGGLCGLIVTTIAYALASSYAGLVVARTLQGVAAAATWTAGPMVLAASAPPAIRGRVMGTAVAGSGLGTLCGPPLGGLLFEVGPAWPFIVAALLLSAVLVAVVVVVPGAVAPRAELPLRRVLAAPAVASVAVCIVAASSTLTLLEPVLPPHLARSFSASPSQTGFAFGVAILAYALAARPAGMVADRIGRVATAAAGLLASSLTLPLIAIAAHPLTVVLALALLGVASAAALGPTLPALADAVDDVARAETGPGTADYASVYALYNAAYAVGMWTGPVAGAALVEAWGFRGGLGVVAVVGTGCAGLVFAGLRRPM